ncbi:hypothetical protein RB195_020041 [Necator americanus]|uniref:Protein BCCIP homolog n=1 Tax=Necator americanus TaxID=51031 RepID=A0ABR1CKG9_NECAM
MKISIGGPGSSKSGKRSLKNKKKLKRKHKTDESEIAPLPSTSTKNKDIRLKKKAKKLKSGRIPDGETESSIAKSQDSDDTNDEELSEGADDNSGDGDFSELFGDGSGQQLDFDIEAFPMEADDRDGIVNMLTQVFLRADIDLPAFADALIAQSPFGIVIGPAEDQCDDDNENVVYGVLTVAELISSKVETPKFAKDIMDFLGKKAQMFALPDFRSALETLKTKRTGVFVNERMLNFPSQIIPPSFNSIRSDYERLKKPYQRIVYVHKLRIADPEPESTVNKNGEEEPMKKKKKMGKAEKKRLAQKALLAAEIIYDNVEDETLVQLEDGEAHFFDYPVHTEIESSSKFHTIHKDGKSFKPYRRVVVMDSQRFKAFLDHVSSSF